ncbi:MAG: archaeosortase/exosortase family protein [Bacteroidales bacterium]
MTDVIRKIKEAISKVERNPSAKYMVHLGIFLGIMLITKYVFEIYFEQYPVFKLDALIGYFLKIESVIISSLLVLFNVDFVRDGTTFTFGNHQVMYIQAGCSGFKQLFQVFFVFFLIPGIWRRKLWYIPVVLVIMFLATNLHLLILSFVAANNPEYFHFTHVWASRIIFYTIMFTTWLIWEEKVGFIHKQIS